MKIFVIVLISFISLFFLAFRPIFNVGAEDCVAVKGLAVKIYEGGVKDINFKLLNDNNHYYINRGLEQGFVLDSIQEAWTGKALTIHYVKHWSILNPKNRVRHVARLEIDEQVLYSEY